MLNFPQTGIVTLRELGAVLGLPEPDAVVFAGKRPDLVGPAIYSAPGIVRHWMLGPIAALNKRRLLMPGEGLHFAAVVQATVGPITEMDIREFVAELPHVPCPEDTVATVLGIETELVRAAAYFRACGELWPNGFRYGYERWTLADIGELLGRSIVRPEISRKLQASQKRIREARLRQKYFFVIQGGRS
jgi:hypothetical protein